MQIKFDANRGTPISKNFNFDTIYKEKIGSRNCKLIQSFDEDKSIDFMTENKIPIASSKFQD